jgi:hypothetical protein
MIIFSIVVVGGGSSRNNNNNNNNNVKTNVITEIINRSNWTYLSRSENA